MAPRKSKSRLTPEEPRQGWAFFESTNTWRKTPSPSGASPDDFPKEWGDWVAVSRPAGWQPDENTRLNLGSSLHAASAAPTSEIGAGTGAASGAGSGGGMKTGAGGHPQPYGWHGWYGTNGGGLSGGPEVRGKVTPQAPSGKAAPAKSAPKPAPKGKVTWSSPLKPTPSEQQLEPNMRETLHTVGEGKDLNVSSAYRHDEAAALKKAMDKAADPHSEGQAVDINYVNGAHIADVANKGGADDAELRRQVEEMQARAANDPNVQAFISPYGGFYKTDTVPPTFRKLDPQDPDVKRHWNHIHIAVFKRK